MTYLDPNSNSFLFFLGLSGYAALSFLGNNEKKAKNGCCADIPARHRGAADLREGFAGVQIHSMKDIVSLFFFTFSKYFQIQS